MSGFEATAEVESFDEAVDWFADRFPITEQLRESLGQYAGSRAWTIAGVTQLDSVMAAHALLGKAIEKGWTPEKTVEELKRVLSAYSFTGSRLNGIVRTNVQLAYNAGRYQQMSDPDLMELRPYRQLDGIDDFRQSNICRERDGLTLPATDPFWLTCWPPLHHGGCRTVVRSLAEWELDDVPGAKRSLPPNLPKVSPGFGLAPDVGLPWRPDLSKYPTHLSNAYRDKEAEAARRAREKAAKLRAAKEAKRRAAEEAERIAQEKAAKLEAERLEKERQAEAEKARKESERIAREYRLAEEKRSAKEAAEKAERERLEAERSAKEEAERLERERLERDTEKRRRIDREKAERKATEESRRAEEARKAEEAKREAEAARKAEQERKEREEADQKRDELAYRLRSEAQEARDKAAAELARQESKKLKESFISFARRDLEKAEERLARINRAAEIRSRLKATGSLQEALDARLLDTDQRKAIEDFTGNAFGAIRRAQSDLKLAKKREYKEFFAQGQAIEKAIEQNVKFEGELWRGISVPKEDAKQILDSGVISWGGKSTSTSVNRKTSEDFSLAIGDDQVGILFRIRNGRGLPVSDLGKEDEAEILQSGSATFRVLGKVQQGKRWVVDLEQVHDKSAVEQLRSAEQDRKKREAEDQKRAQKAAEKARAERERKAESLARKKDAENAAKERPFTDADYAKLPKLSTKDVIRLDPKTEASGEQAQWQSMRTEQRLTPNELEAMQRWSNGYDATIRKMQSDPTITDEQLFDWRRKHVEEKASHPLAQTKKVETEAETRAHVLKARRYRSSMDAAWSKWREAGEKPVVSTVYRGLGGFTREDISKLVDGKVLTMRGQTSSASWHPRIGSQFARNNAVSGRFNVLLKLKTKTGMPVETMSEIASEREVLLHGDSRYRIKKVYALDDESVGGDITKFTGGERSLGSIMVEAEEI